MSDTRNIRNMTEGSPAKHIAAFTVPVFLGMLFQQFYSMADTAIVGRLIGASAFGAVGSAGGVMYFFFGFCTGIMAGFAIPVSQAFGAGDARKLKKIVGNSIWLTAVISAIMTLLTTAFARQLLILMKTPEDILDTAYTYLIVVFAGLPATMLYNLTAAYLRAIGNSRVPTIFLLISSFLNIALDVLMIIVLKMGVRGAALATVASQLICGVACLIYIAVKCEPLHVSSRDLIPNKKAVGILFSNGFPMGLQYSVTAIGAIVLQYFINQLGTTYIAAMTAANKVGMFFCILFDALGSATATFCGQNTGARKPDRVNRGVLVTLAFACFYGVLVFLIMVLFGKNLTMIFLRKEETEIISLSAKCLVIMSSFYVLLAIINVLRFAIQGMGYSSLAVVAGMLELIGRAGAGIILVPLFGFTGACFGSPLAWVFADVFLIPAYILCVKKLKKQLQPLSTNVN